MTTLRTKVFHDPLIHNQQHANGELDMFRSLRTSKLPDDHVFAVTVGDSGKQTLAGWYLVDPSKVISAIATLNGTVDANNIGVAAVI